MSICGRLVDQSGSNDNICRQICKISMSEVLFDQRGERILPPESVMHSSICHWIYRLTNDQNLVLQSWSTSITAHHLRPTRGVWRYLRWKSFVTTQNVSVVPQRGAESVHEKEREDKPVTQIYRKGADTDNLLHYSSCDESSLKANLASSRGLQ